MDRTSSRGHSLWPVVLAGGDGQRTRPFITRWLGKPLPKQYCTFSGDRSLFQQTLDRTELLAPPRHRVTVAARWHRDEVMKQLLGRDPGHVIFQPENRGTAPGVFLSLCHVRAKDPGATVILFPSDHFVYPEAAFATAVRKTAEAVDRIPGSILLLGAAPDRLESDYGWIEPGPPLVPDSRCGVRIVRRFLEKPSLDQARRTMALGGLWNTFVVVARLETLWEVAWHCLPRMMQIFELYAPTLGLPADREVLDKLYRIMPSHDFSADILQRIPARLGVVEMADVIWSDWGRPERIAETLERVGQTPAFPLEALVAS